MKKALALLALGAGVIGLSASTASASPGLKLDRQDISSKQCQPDHTAKQLVNVHYTLLNDDDSGFAGNYWATDTIDRHLRIFEEGDGTYCVQVADHGTFVTHDGASPSGSSTVTAGIEGTLEGGYITSDVVGTFDAGRATSGNLGTFDVGGSDPVASWVDYFSTVTSKHAFAQWGWIYHAGRNGTWLNQDDVAAAASGDITG